jgi:hypothetical protein
VISAKFGALVIPIDVIGDLGTRNNSVRDRDRKEGKLAAGDKLSHLLLGRPSPYAEHDA